jgi:ribosome-binding protein aMBF1 (putative translation factor)|nr:helix-turn-helix transcriptional regulator [uncultured Emticicia sp.]
MNKPRQYDSPIIKRIAERIPKELSEQNDRRMGLAVKIAEALWSRGLTNQEFAFMMGKKPSEVTRWLSGTHNFTTETLWQMERVLRIQLLTSFPPEEHIEKEQQELKEFIANEVQKALTKFMSRKKLAV